LYEAVRPALVGFASRVVQGGLPKFRHIIGTGFVVDERGIVATNRPVVDALMQLPPYPANRQTGWKFRVALPDKEVIVSTPQD
jgi:hypothetical protein